MSRDLRSRRRNSGYWTTTQARSSPGTARSLRRRVMKPDAGNGTSINLDVETLQIGAQHGAIGWVDCRRHHDPAPPRAAGNGHQRAFRQRRRAVVHRRVRDVHPGQRGDQALKLVDDLQCALGDLRLIWGVRGVELAAGQDLPDRRRYEVPIGAGAEDRRLRRRRHIAIRQTGADDRPLPFRSERAANRGRKPDTPRERARRNPLPTVAALVASSIADAVASVCGLNVMSVFPWSFDARPADEI